MCKKILGLTFVLTFSMMSLWAQSVNMHFPAFAGKGYSFYIFQGSEKLLIQKDTVPQSGRFELKIPQVYTPYSGICRWSIDQNQGGGGLDIVLPGKSYAISCASEVPNADNIIYTGYQPAAELQTLLQQQQPIIDKFHLMTAALRLYDSKHPKYNFFRTEQQSQKHEFDKFVKYLEQERKNNYHAHLLPILNLRQGLAHQLSAKEEVQAVLMAESMAKYIRLKDLYTSPYWEELLSMWVIIHTDNLKNDSLMLADFKLMGQQLHTAEAYTNFVQTVTRYLNMYGKDKYIDVIAPAVLSSGKIVEYSGKLAVYQKALLGLQAADLVLADNTHLPSTQFANANFDKTLLVFFQSNCGHCEDLISKLIDTYGELVQKGIDIIALSADEDEQVFANTIKKFPWQRNYCDFKGSDGINFKNYAVPGTPAVYLINKNGKIEAKMASFEEIMKMI